MLTPAWFPMRPHALQSQAWRSKSRTVVLCCGRFSGKTELARRRIVTYLPVKKPWPDPKYFFALPTYGQAKKVAWDKLLQLIPKHWLAKEPGTSSMMIETIFGSRLYVLGLDKPARIEGVEWDGGVIDESSDQKAGTFDRSVRPALAAKEGWCWRIGVPKRFGPGAREYKRAFELGQRREAGYESYTWPSWDIARAEEIDNLRQQLDTKDFNEQIGGNWVDAGGAAYHEFDKQKNVRPVTYCRDKLMVIMSDFNVDPMAWCMAHFVDTEHGRGFEVFDELWMRNTNTKAALDVVYARYGTSHQGGFHFVGDATGRARKTASTSSDYRIILNDTRFKAKVRYPKGNPAVKDRLASVNCLLNNAAGHRRLFIDPRCVHLIDDLENRSLTPEGAPVPADPSYAGDSGHMTDALGYGVHYFFPIVVTSRQGNELIVIGN